MRRMPPKATSATSRSPNDFNAAGPAFAAAAPGWLNAALRLAATAFAAVHHSNLIPREYPFAERRLAGEECDHLDAASEVAVPVVGERAVIVDDAVIGIERSRSDHELVARQRRAGYAGERREEAPTGGYLLQAAFATRLRLRTMRSRGSGAQDLKLGITPRDYAPNCVWLPLRRSVAVWRRCAILKEPVLDLGVDPVHPLLGVRGAVLIVPDLALELRDTVFRGAQLQRQLVGDVHGAFAVLLGDVDRLLQQSNHRMAGAVDRIAFGRTAVAVRGCERDDLFWGSLIHGDKLHSTKLWPRRLNR